ncbi:MAG: AAA family ATPase [Methylobacterium sp.]|uniref:ATP-dependent DNA helicase n=1 Tax=Methylobacterium sp. TaxID=409 RepID=UPI0025FFA211|nr:AAA family ATPase [Methylobacterium sp.]MBX9930137.1 AAA family ATPase [Methylobacterium sp.]
MPTHITARLAWHADGWDGSVCSSPEQNSYCVGWKSFPGDVIARERDLEVEGALAGCRGSALKGYVPPCSYSYNAFGLDPAKAASNPPDFFHGGAARREWEMDPATVSVWPYEAMYGEDITASGRTDNDLRRRRVLEFFRPIRDDCGSNLIFYYANYSNPISNEETPRYVLVGVSRITKVGAEFFYEDVTPEIASRYAGGMIWARDITSAYPDEGLRLPLHSYADDPERLAQVAVIPDNPVLFKYGSKHLTDDQAIGLLEQLLDKVRMLRAWGDTSENWEAREGWLLSTIAELWRTRGLYPGLLRALDAAGAADLIDTTKAYETRRGGQAAVQAAFDWLDGASSGDFSPPLTPKAEQQIRRAWSLLPPGAADLLRAVLSRFDLPAETMRSVISDGRASSGLPFELKAISDNPYLLSECYRGDSADDRIPWGLVDRGVIPEPHLGGGHLAEMTLDDPRRFRSLCVDHLNREPSHTFRQGEELIAEIRERVARFPDWKQAAFSDRYFDADKAFLEPVIHMEADEQGRRVYLGAVHEDERLVEATLRGLTRRPDISLRRPIGDEVWKGWTYKSDSSLAELCGELYRKAAFEQAEICARLFRQPICVVTGPAGTGKTSVIEALVRAVRHTEGEGANVTVLAPTGKATDRAREIFQDAGLSGVSTNTIHSLLASKGWLNDNFTLKRKGGQKAAISTLIVDEASMLDLVLAAALFRCIEWNAVRRLILVGDAGQLPPIGRGRVFADIIAWLNKEAPAALGRLSRNLRQLRNEASSAGTAIVRLAELFVVDNEDKLSEHATERPTRPDQEALIERLHGGGKIDADLDVIFWDEESELPSILIETVERRMRGMGAEGDDADALWRSALEADPTRFQILTPHRGESHGVEALNDACQSHRCKKYIDTVGLEGGVTLTDKVIQIRNRPVSDMIWAYDYNARGQKQVQVFNGEIGNVRAIGFDARKLWSKVNGNAYGMRLSRFAVHFKRNPQLGVGYGRKVPTPRYERTEKVEDNLELAYAVSVHKAQGSEFEHTFVIVPSSARRLVSTELTYTALTRATRHCTLLVEGGVKSLLDSRRRENAQTPQINSSLFTIHVARRELTQRRGWYEAGKIHEALTGDMLRSKSEVIIANLLHERQAPFLYENPLVAQDGTMRLPDFTITWQGQSYYWEHLGLLELSTYADAWKAKQAWYEKWFPGQLVTTQEGPYLSREVDDLLGRLMRGELTAADA